MDRAGDDQRDMEWEQPHWSGRPQNQDRAQRRLRPNGFAKVARYSAANRYAVIGLYMVMALVCGAYAAVALNVDPDAGTRILLDPATNAVQQELDRQFPGIDQTFIAIVESRDGEAARGQAQALAASMNERADLIASAFVPGTGRFYDTNAMLFESVGEVGARVDALLQMRPLYEAIAAAPDMLGLAALVSEIGKAVEQGRSPPGLEALLLTVADAIEGEVAGAPRPVDWPSLAGLGTRTGGTRWFVVAMPQPGREREAAAAARQSSDGMQGVRWLWPRRALGRASNPLRDFLVPAGISVFVTLTLLGAGLGSFRLTPAVILPSAATVAVAGAVAALPGQPLDGATWSFAAAALAPATVASVIYVLAYMQARGRGVAVPHAIMLAAQRRGGLITLFACVFCAFWISWLVRQLPSLSHFAVIALAGTLAAWAMSLTLVPAAIALADRGAVPAEPHWLDDALRDPTSYHARNVLDIAAMIIMAAAVFCVVFLPGVRFGERHLPSNPGPLLETPDARGAMHVLVRPGDAEATIGQLVKLPEIGAIRTIAQFLPAGAPEKIAELKRLETAALPLPAQRPPQEEDVLHASLADLERELGAIAAGPASSASLRAAALRLRKAVTLFTGSGPPPAERVRGLERTLFSGFGELPRATERLARLAAPAIADLEPLLLRRFVSDSGLWRIEVMPKPDVGFLSFAAAIRRAMPSAAGEPLAALVRNEIIHHETLLALAAALVGVAIVALAALRNVPGWLLSMVPVSAFVTLTAAGTVLLGIVLNAAMLAGASAVAAVLVTSSVVIAQHLAPENPENRGGGSTAMRAGLLPPLILAGTVAPLAISTLPMVAELGAVMALMLLMAAMLCMLLIPPLARWLKRG